MARCPQFSFILLLLSWSSAFIETSQQGSMSACEYPHFSDNRLCGIHDPQLLEGWVCDPDNIFSMSEVYIIDNTLRMVYSQQKSQCECPLTSFNASDKKTKTRGKRKKPCWYKFGFAFLKELNPTARAVAEAQSNEHCSNHSLSTADQSYVLTNPETAFLYAQNYARVLREQWAIGECGEDILILVVQTPPDTLVSSSRQPSVPKSTSSHLPVTPMIFVSYGSHVVERFGTMNTYTLPYALEPLRRIVDEANSNLRNAYPLNKVLNNMVLETVESLINVQSSLKSPHPKSHVPLWAWMIFGVCGLMFLLMGVGLYLIRTNTRRSVQRGKAGNAEPSRRWKAGFVGDEAQPKATTYVKAMSLISIMMPHSKQTTSNNQSQQV